MIINGKIVVPCNSEYYGSYYYFNTKECLWFGHIKSEIMVVKRKIPRPDYMQKILTKIAIKMGYPKEIFRAKKIEHTHTHTVPKSKQGKPKASKKKNTVSKKQSSTFVSLF